MSRRMVDPDVLISAKMVAQICDVVPSAVSNWRKRPETGFPAPIVTIAGTDLWDRDSIEEWSKNRPRKMSSLAERVAQLERRVAALEAKGGS